MFKILKNQPILSDISYIHDNAENGTINFEILQDRKILSVFFNGEWYKYDGAKTNDYVFGQNINRPNSPLVGQVYFNTQTNSLNIFNGDVWRDIITYPIDCKKSGLFSEKPTVEMGANIGFAYFCTDKKTIEGTTNGIMIYHKGNNVWVDALGRVVS